MKYANIYANEGNNVFDKSLRDYMYLIYKNMGISLMISALVAFIVGTNPALLKMFFSNRLISLVVALAPIFFVFSINKAIFTKTVEEAKNSLFIFAGLMGLSLSTIFVMYTKENIFQTFLTSAAMFGSMSLYGYKTKSDLTKWQSFLYMGLFGLLFASLFNIFFKSSSLSFGISCIGVVLFTLYTAYDVKKLKDLHNYVSLNTDAKERIAIFGALQLYLDFINLFIYLLEIFSRMSNNKNE